MTNCTSQPSRAILRDHKGETIGAWSETNISPDAFIAKTKTTILAIKVAISRHIPKIVFERDASNVIGALLGQFEKEE